MNIRQMIKTENANVCLARELGKLVLFSLFFLFEVAGIFAYFSVGNYLMLTVSILGAIVWGIQLAMQLNSIIVDLYWIMQI